jgi:hypothetical protein
VNRRAARCCAVVLSAVPLALSAHRLDEYLQATRVSLATDRIVLEMELTPGVDVASLIFASIDTDQDGRIAADEGRAYANRVLEDVELELDGTLRPLDLIRTEFPTREEMGAGIGVVRIEARAPWPGVAGRHTLHYRNDHRPALSAYLVNALVPTSRAVRITGQHRDAEQREFRLEFEIAEPSSPAAAFTSTYLRRLTIRVLRLSQSHRPRLGGFATWQKQVELCRLGYFSRAFPQRIYSGHSNGHRLRCLRSVTDFGNGQIAQDFGGESIWYLRVPGHGLDGTRIRIAPE